MSYQFPFQMLHFDPQPPELKGEYKEKKHLLLGEARKVSVASIKEIGISHDDLPYRLQNCSGALSS